MTAVITSAPTAEDDLGEPPADVLRYRGGGRGGHRAGEPRRCIKCARWLIPPDAAETSTASPAVRDRSQPGGVGARCVPCAAADANARYAADPEAARAGLRARYAADPEAARDASRAWRAAYASRSDEETAAARVRLRPDGLKRCRRCRERLPLEAFSVERTQPDGLRWVCRSCDIKGIRRRAEAYWTAIQLPEWISKRCYLCAGPLGAQWHVEHLVPLAAGGTDDVENLAPACGSCNSSKNARNVADVVTRRHPLWRGLSPDHPAVLRLHDLAGSTPGCTNPAAAVEFIRQGPSALMEA